MTHRGTSLRAEIIAVGSEMLGPARMDTNSLFLAHGLAALGVSVARKQIVADDATEIAAVLRERCRHAELVICTGGLGPTHDDLTLAAAARACGTRFAKAEPLANGVGSAPGRWCQLGDSVLVLLPGPPRELEPMFELQVRPRLEAMLPRQARFTRVLSIAGMPEEGVEKAVGALYRRVRNPTTTILATADPQIELHFHGSGNTPRAAQLRADAVAKRVTRRLGKAVFSRDGESLAAVVGKKLRRRQQTLAVAESCTGGLLGARLTAEPGASKYFLGGVLAYSDTVKCKLLSVPAATLKREGAVSATTAKFMAKGVRQKLGADWGLSITGIAGPDGGSDAKPVGSVYIGWAAPNGATGAQHFLFRPDRERIRRFSAQAALNHLRLKLET